ncbi:putative gustatory receptor 36b [Stomoxys calcitrans]|uniref:putative gustatory receptor 36b n=1 Tax=Stomoxys calcitrans TaxID=35570 RepID=UPI0027E31C2D|nr:putative gustatory receptor 36b [Stomoxys calcitrans]
MRRSTEWMISATYITSVLFGVTSLCYVETTGEVYTKPLVTIYSALANIGMLVLVPHFLRFDYYSPSLPVQINTLIFLLKAVSSIITVFINWTKRGVFVKTLNELSTARLKFMRRWPLSEKIKQKYETTLRRKLLLGFMAMVGLMLSSIEYVQRELKLRSFHMIVAAVIMFSIVNVVMLNYFVCMSNLNVILWAINEELEKIIQTTHQLWNLRIIGQIGPGTLITECCKLSDDLDELAVTQHQLNLLRNRIYRMYDIQTACVLVMVYLNNVLTFYMSFPTQQKSKILDEYSNWSMAVMPFMMMLYYIDLALFIKEMTNFEVSGKATGKLLRERQLFYPALDMRLEESRKHWPG